jgi:phospholipase/carboxylesterase
MAYLPCIELESGRPSFSGTGHSIDASIIWLHGLGASGDDFAPIVPELHLPADAAIRFVFPHAPAVPVTINGGMVMPAWYDILSLNNMRTINESQFTASVEAVVDLINREIERGVSSERIILAGFSQGGAIAYSVALNFSQPLAGLMTMSTYFPDHQPISPHEANRNLPIHIFHGTYDPMVTEVRGKQALDILRELGYTPEYKNYPMAHEVCREQIDDISTWVQNRLGL